MTLSAIVITKNEEAMIGRCLESVAWADEIVVVDSGSTDRTQDICRGLGAIVQLTPDWPGPGPQRNRAIDLAKGDWILALDADEWVTEDLRREIPRRERHIDDGLCPPGFLHDPETLRQRVALLG